jgi:protein O-mannosyl-transferase
VRHLLTKRIRAPLLLSAALVIVALVYRPGLDGPLVFDDYPNIVDNPTVAAASLTYDSLKDAAFSRGAGIAARPLALLSFALNARLERGATDAYWYKLTNLAIHIINTILIFWLSRLLLRQHLSRRAVPEHRRDIFWLPPLIAAAWSLHPLNLDPVLYVVQRMTSLATLFMLAGSVSFVIGRQHLADPPRRGLVLMTVGAAGGVVLGLLAKEIALLVPLYLLVIELTFFGNSAQRRPASAHWFHGVTLGTIAVTAAGYMLLHYPEQVGAYAARDFTVGERLLTEARVLWFYASLIVMPVPYRFALFHDDIAVSSSLLSPWTTLPAVLGLITLVVAAISLRRRWPLFSFAILWFMAGHVMESSVIGLEIAHEHRNYLPSFGPLFAIVYGLTEVIRAKGSGRWLPPVASVLALIAALSFVTMVRVQEWTSERTLIASLAHDHPNSPRSLTMLGEWTAVRRDDPLTALLYYARAMALAPNDAGIRLRTAMTAVQPALQAELRARVSDDQNKRVEQVGVDLSDIAALDRLGDRAPELQVVFIDRTAQLLRDRPLSADTQEMLIRLGRCLADVSRPCSTLVTPATQWYSAVLENPHVNAALADYATLTLFNVAIDRKAYLAALDAADNARRRDPRNPTYELMRANALILMKDYGQATTILDAVMRHKDVSPDIRENVDTLKDMLERRQDGGQTTPSR